MSVKLRTKTSLIIALSAALLCSCGTKEELFDSYNSCFVPLASASSPFTLTPDTQGEMLRDVYEVSFDYPAGVTLALSCPAECDTYDWKITPLNESQDADALSDGQNGTYRWGTRNVSFYITKSDNCVFYKDVKESGQSCSYRIHLAVTVGNQGFYDSAVLAVRALGDEGAKE